MCTFNFLNHIFFIGNKNNFHLILLKIVYLCCKQNNWIMKFSKRLSSLIIGLFFPAIFLLAQDQNNDNRYLEGAVPEVNGRVVFSKDFAIPGLSKDEVYARSLNWMNNLIEKNGNDSRLLYSNTEEGQIVGTTDKVLVFSSSAFSLDRAHMIFQLFIQAEAEKCKMEVSKIRYNYREGKEKYTAEEWIVDKYALNKDRTKLVKGLAKWRKSTINYIDTLYIGLINSLSKASTSQQNEETSVVDKIVRSNQTKQPFVIKTESNTNEKVQNTDSEPESAKIQTVTAQNLSQTNPNNPLNNLTTDSPAISEYIEMKPSELRDNFIQASNGKLVIVIGTDEFNRTTMTANGGGSLGNIEGNKVVYTLFNSDQPHQQMYDATNYKVLFYPNGKTKPSVILECKKRPHNTNLEGQPIFYIGEIVKAQVLK